MKNCSVCNQTLPLTSFDIQSTGRAGRRADCKECRKRFHRSEAGLVKSLFGNQKAKSRKRRHAPPAYSEAQLYAWVIKQPNFQVLFDVWVRADYETNLKPSIDRLDDYQGYTLTNIKLVTVKENLDRYYTDAVSGLNTKSATAVDQYSLDGAFIQSHHSYSAAARAVGGDVNPIRNVALGTPITRNEPDGSTRSYVPAKAYGFIWRHP